MQSVIGRILSDASGFFARARYCPRNNLDFFFRHAARIQLTRGALHVEWIRLQLSGPSALLIVVSKNYFRRAALFEELRRLMSALDVR